MYHRYVALIIFACTFAPLSPLRTHAASLPAVVLSEIQWGGSALSTADEWIELANVSSESIDISSWKITGVASQGAEIVIPAGTVLLSHATYLVANYALGDAKTALAVSPDLVSSSVSISNSSLTVTLVTADGIIIDSYSDQETPGVGSSSPHASAERNLEDGTWFTSVSSQNLLAGETLGSPGYALFPVIAATAEQEIAPDDDAQEETSLHVEVPEVSDEILIVEEATSSEVLDVNSIQEISPPESSAPESISETDLSTPEEVILEEEIIILIAPVSPDVVTSSVEEVFEEIEVGDLSVDTALPQDDTDSVTTETITITTMLDYSFLRVTEFVSDPSDGKEWIELWNSGTPDLSLDGIVLTDAAGKETILSGSLQSSTYVLIENPNGKLNNTDDTITLTLPDGQTLFTLAYGTTEFPAPKKGLSAGLCDDGWHADLVPSPALPNSCPTTILESPTYDTEISYSPTVELSSSASGASPAIQGDVPVEENSGSTNTPLAQITTSVVHDAVVSTQEKTSSASQKSSSSATSTSPSGEKKTSSKSTILSVELKDLETLPSGQRVEVTGIIVAEPGMFGKRIAYLDGVQLYFHKATWPSLPLGTSVHLVGTWDYDGDSRRIKISDASDIDILGSETVQPISWDDVSAETASDILVTASGTLTKKEGETYIFSSLTGKDFRVVDEAKTGALSILRAGDYVTISGILFPSDGNWILAPRSADDIVIAAPIVSTQETSSLSLPALPSTSQTSDISSTPIIGGGILACSVSALGYWFFRSKKLSFLFS